MADKAKLVGPMIGRREILCLMTGRELNSHACEVLKQQTGKGRSQPIGAKPVETTALSIARFFE